MDLEPKYQVPGVYHRRVGNIVVTALSDGYADAGIDTIRNIELSEALAMFESDLRPVRRASINCYLVHSAGRIALIDTGSGRYFGPTAGQLLLNLSAAGITAEDVDTILLTHMHPDHSAGLTDTNGGARIFPYADLVVHEDELTHWFDDAQMEMASEEDRALFFHTAREQVGPYYNSLMPFHGNVEVFPGVTSVPLPGHTPGHSGFLISSEGQELMVWGDIVHIPEIQISRPEVTLTFDCNQALAAKTRNDLFEYVSNRKLLVAGMHLDFPGFAHVVRRANIFHLVPEPWAHTMFGVMIRPTAKS